MIRISLVTDILQKDPSKFVISLLFVLFSSPLPFNFLIKFVFYTYTFKFFGFLRWVFSFMTLPLYVLCSKSSFLSIHFLKIIKFRGFFPLVFFTASISTKCLIANFLNWDYSYELAEEITFPFSFSNMGFLLNCTW
jgi:hypothetical protein